MHLFTMSEMCGAHVRYLSNVSPRNLTLFWKGMGELLRVSVGVVASRECLGWKTIPMVLVVLMLKPHLEAHRWIWVSCVCILCLAVLMFLDDVHIAASSAYLAVWIWVVLFSKMSSIMILKRVGLMTLPWGVPFWSCCGSDVVFPNPTLMILFVRKF